MIEVSRQEQYLRLGSDYHLSQHLKKRPLFLTFWINSEIGIWRWQDKQKSSNLLQLFALFAINGLSTTSFD